VFTAIGVCHTAVLKMGKITSIYIWRTADGGTVVKVLCYKS
jgi:hypothetical protein